MTLIPVKLTTRALLALSLFFAVSLPGQAAVTVTEGKQYTKLANPVKEAPPVVEFFSFYCPACSSFYSPYQVSKNIENILPEGGKVEKYHASFMGVMGKQLTEAWSIAKALGVEDKVEGPLFEAVLKERSVKSEDDIRAVFIQAGVDAGEFDAARNRLQKNLVLPERRLFMSTVSTRLKTTVLKTAPQKATERNLPKWCVS